MSETAVEIKVNPAVQQLLTAEQAWRFMAVPYERNNGSLKVYLSDSRSSGEFQDELELITGLQIVVETVPEHSIEQALTRFYRKSGSTGSDLLQFSGDGNLLEKMVQTAQEMGASDIHFECYEEGARIRFRIDGHLVERYSIPLPDYPSLINRIKISAQLDIAEKRLPQDGRIMIGEGVEGVDIRVSILPTLHGEKAVLRLLSRDATGIDISRLGFSEAQLEKYLLGTGKPHGIVLISGPTGSGKTTTLYATLKVLNQENRNIVTIEDPIEYTLEGVNQVQLKESIGLDFTAALRTFLRQDPDVIMLGEIRDEKTARMAIRASLTGHLVLSTIHTNSAWGTINRLSDMGIPAYLIAGTMNLSIAQRLVRKLCPECKIEKPLESSDHPKSVSTDQLPKYHSVAQGCEQCHFSGYQGRKAIYEVISINRELSDTIKEGRSDVHDILIEQKVRSISDQALELVQNQETSLAEVYNLLLNEY